MYSQLSSPHLLLWHSFPEKGNKISVPVKSNSTLALHLLSNRRTWLQQNTQSLLKYFSIYDPDHVHRRYSSLVVKIFCILIKFVVTEMYKYVKMH